jgi:hypothetical protein
MLCIEKGQDQTKVLPSDAHYLMMKEGQRRVIQ